MSKRSPANRTSKQVPAPCLKVLCELRLRLGEINTKLDHLIKNYRRFYFVTGSSASNPREFED